MKLLLILSLSFFSCHLGAVQSNKAPITHELWDELLHKHVTPDGRVDYKGFLNDRERLDKYLKLLSNNPPNGSTWSKEERLAYWINVYNAFTVELILQNYPLESIKDIKTINIPLVNSPWTIKFFSIGDKEYNLDHVEHKILRKEFNEPRIHFAVNCASVSCPILKNEAFTPEQLEDQLEAQAIYFINNPDKNIIREDELQISKIFDWFKGDFTKDGSLINFLNQYSKVKIQEKAKVSYLEYDWGLNE